MGRVRVRADDPEIASLALYTPLPWSWRLDVLPFVLLYLTALYLYLVRPDGDAVPVLLGAVSVFANALAFLAGEWSVDMSAWLGFVPLQDLAAGKGDAAAVYVKVVPASAMLTKQMCRCVVVDSSDSAHGSTAKQEKREVPLLWFSYQNLTLGLFDDAKALMAGHASFRRLDYPTQLPLHAYTRRAGYSTSEDVERALLKWGRNDFEIPIPTFRALLKEQLVAPFFVFQFFCMLLWCLDEYVYYSLMTLAMLVVFECTVVKQRQRNMETLNGMRRAPRPVFVYRNKKWTEIWSDKLVPGDICSIGQKLPGVITHPGEEKLTVVPCDMLLLRGDCVVNESMLTGESVPLRKEALAVRDADSDDALGIDDGTSQEHKKHVLFGGTKVLQHMVPSASQGPLISTPPDKGCVAYVLRTGFGTTQGSLMRTILHSSQRVTANNTEAMWFILLLLGFAVAAAGLVLNEGLHDPTRNRFKLFLHCIMIVTSVVPPELPMELSLAVTNSLLALMKFNIFCTEPFRISFAGRVDVCCFDKTGTLTSDDLKMLGVAGLAYASSNHDSEFDVLAPTHLPLDSELVLAGCQSLVFLNGQIMGDPLEATALQNIKWTLSFGTRAVRDASTVEPSVFSSRRGDIQALHVLHRFSFSSDLKRMTTIASIVKGDNDEEDELRVLTKGAPEVLEPLFSQKPTYYRRVYRHFASRGQRVLALGFRDLKGVEPTTLAVDDYVRSTGRNEIECNLTYAGFLVMECPLKEDTRRTIKDLMASKHKIIVITGDNALTACDTGRQIGINDKKSSLILQITQARGEGSLEWSAVDDGSKEESEVKTVRFDPLAIKRLSEEHSLCVTGDALTTLYRTTEVQYPNDEVQAHEAYLQLLSELCPHIDVYARTSPQQKEHVIMALNRSGMTTAMCGDGTNDVGALKRAHVGVSIVNNPEAENSHRSLASQFGAEENSLQAKLRAIQEDEEERSVRLGDASIASPFTSKSSSIRVVKQLIRQGRCTLVTTIQMYKILGVNCLITAYYLSALYMHGVKNGDQQLTIVGLAIAMFFLFLSRARPAKRLHRERPPSGVFCTPVLLSILGQSFLHLGFLVGGLQIAQPFIDRSDPSMHPDGKFTPNVVNSIMFLLSAVMQLNTFVVNYKGQPFMESFWDHKLLCRSALLSYGLLMLAVLEVFPWLSETLELVPMPTAEVKHLVFASMASNTIAVLALEWLIERRFAKWH